MKRRGILKVAEEIIKILSKEKECSIQYLATKTKSQWITIVKILEFLKKIGVVKERKGNVTYRAERLFRLD